MRTFQPSNIFFAMNGQVKIGDFGLATAILEESDREAAETAAQRSEGKGRSTAGEKYTDRVGTMLYMSPEQVLLQSGSAESKSDMGKGLMGF